MPFTNLIVDYINSWLENGTLNRFKPIKCYNIASQILKREPTGAEGIFPGVQLSSGEIESVTPDDDYNIIIYHKINSNVYGIQKRGSVGDAYDLTCTSDMTLYVFAQAMKIEMTAEQLEPIIVFGLPGGISSSLSAETYIKFCSITPISSDMDRVRNFKSEYQGIEDFLKPEHLFFSIKYTIKKVFDKSCIDGCLSCV
jgi:hypothetical protein